MGYRMDQGESQFMVQTRNVAGALAAMHEMAQEALATSTKFRYIETKDILAATTLEEHLKEWGWKAKFDTEGNWIAIKFVSECLGDEVKLFQAIAPFVERGSFLVMHGEEGETWRWYFNGEECVEQSAAVQFATPPEPPIDVDARDVSAEDRKKRLLT